MSDEDSLNEMSVSPQRLMPKVPTIPEHHRVLSVNALQHGNSISTFKAHKIRIDDLDERVDELEGLRDDISDLRGEMSRFRETMVASNNGIQLAMSQLGAIVGQHSIDLTEKKSGMELKKAIIVGVIGLLGTCASVFGGYMWAHQPGGPAYVAPTHQQAEQIDAKLKGTPEYFRQVEPAH